MMVLSNTHLVAEMTIPSILYLVTEVTLRVLGKISNCYLVLLRLPSICFANNKYLLGVLRVPLTLPRVLGYQTSVLSILGDTKYT